MPTLMQFKLNALELNFEAGGDYPASRPVELFQVQDRTAAGILQIEDLGVQVRRRSINFNLMSQADYDALLDWFLNVVNGGMETFEFTDEKGFAGDVKITDQIIDFTETSFERYSGSLNVEYVQ